MKRRKIKPINPPKRQSPQKKALLKSSTKTEANQSSHIVSQFEYTSSDDELFDKKSTKIYTRSKRNKGVSKFNEAKQTRSKPISKNIAIKSNNGLQESKSSDDVYGCENKNKKKVSLKPASSTSEEQTGETDCVPIVNQLSICLVDIIKDEGTHSNENDCRKETSSRQCPVCNFAFSTEVSEQKFNEHVNSCLDQGNVTTGQMPKNNENNIQTAKSLLTKTDEELARELQEREDEKHHEEILSDQLFFCSFCQKELTSMNSGTRQAHMNKCADLQVSNLSKSQRVERKLLAKENPGGLECYVCGLKFSDPKSRISHMKLCSKGKNISPKVLMDLISSEQRRDLKNAENTVSDAEHFGEEKQTHDAKNDVNSAIRNSLEQAADSKKAQPKRKKISKKKARNEQIPALLQRSEEEAKQMLAKKAANIIAEQLGVKHAEKPAFLLPASGLLKKYECKGEKQCLIDLRRNSSGTSSICKNSEKMNGDAFLWNLAAVKNNSYVVSDYYVRDVFADDLILTEKITLQKSSDVDHSLDALVNQREKEGKDGIVLEIADKQSSDNNGADETRTMNFENSFTMTQKEKAEILDKLGKDEDTDEQLDKDISSWKSDVDETCDDDVIQCSGFYKSVIECEPINKHITAQKSEALHALAEDMSRLLADETNKDVTIRCCDGKLRAHSLILTLRSPQLMKDLENGSINIDNVSKDAIQCLLFYLYTGSLDIYPHLVEDITVLAKRFSLDALALVCNAVSEKSERLTDVAPDPENSCDNVKTLLKNLWKNEDSPENNDEASEADDPDSGSEFDESDADDLRYFFATQKERKSIGLCIDGKDKCIDDENDAFTELLLNDDVKETGCRRTTSDLTLIENMESLEGAGDGSNCYSKISENAKDRLDENVTADNADHVCGVRRNSPINLLNENNTGGDSYRERDVIMINNEIRSSISFGNSLNISLDDIPTISAEECSQIQIVQSDDIVKSFLQDLSMQAKDNPIVRYSSRGNAESFEDCNEHIAGECSVNVSPVIDLSRDGDSVQPSPCFDKSEITNDQPMAESHLNVEQIVDLSGDGDSFQLSPCLDKSEKMNNKPMAASNANEEPIVDLSGDGDSLRLSACLDKSEKMNDKPMAASNANEEPIVDLSGDGDSIQISPCFDKSEKMNDKPMAAPNANEEPIVDLSGDGDSLRLSAYFDKSENNCSLYFNEIQKSTDNDVIDIDGCDPSDGSMVKQSLDVHEPCVSFTSGRDQRKHSGARKIRDKKSLIFVSPSSGTPKAFESSFSTPTVKITGESTDHIAYDADASFERCEESVADIDQNDKFQLSFIDDDIPSADLIEEAPESPCVASSQFNNDLTQRKSETKCSDGITSESPRKSLSGDMINVGLEDDNNITAIPDSNSESDEVVDVSPDRYSYESRHNSSFDAKTDKTRTTKGKNTPSHFNSSLSAFTSTPNKRKAISVESSDSDEQAKISKNPPPKKKLRSGRESKESKDLFKALVKNVSSKYRSTSPESSSEVDSAETVTRNKDEKSCLHSSEKDGSPWLTSRVEPSKSKGVRKSYTKRSPTARKSFNSRPVQRQSLEKISANSEVHSENLNLRIDSNSSSDDYDQNVKNSRKIKGHCSFELLGRSIVENLDDEEKNSRVSCIEAEPTFTDSVMYGSGILVMASPGYQDTSSHNSSDFNKRFGVDSVKSVNKACVDRVNDSDGSVCLQIEDRESVSMGESGPGEHSVLDDGACASRPVSSRATALNRNEIDSSCSDYEDHEKIANRNSFIITDETKEAEIEKEVTRNENKDIESNENEVSWNEYFEADCFIDDGGYNCDIADEIANEQPPSNNSSMQRNLHSRCPEIDSSSNAQASINASSQNKRSKVSRSSTPVNLTNGIEDGIILSDSDGDDSDDDVSEEDSNARTVTNVNNEISKIAVEMQPRVAVVRTPNTALRNFGPGCTKHPETNLTITPMSDYDALETPALTKRIKVFGMRKLPKRQMAGKLREIYKMQHGFKHWEESPPKLKHKKRKGNVGNTEKSTKTSVNEAESNEVNDSDGYSSSDNRRKTMFEGPIESDNEDDGSQSSQVEEEETLFDKLFNFIKNHQELYEKVLTYQKFDFMELYKMVKSAGIKCSKQRLIDFLDDQCICFICPRPGQGKTRRKQGRRTKKLNKNDS